MSQEPLRIAMESNTKCGKGIKEGEQKEAGGLWVRGWGQKRDGDQKCGPSS